MRKKIHPEYGYAVYRCPSTGTEILTRSTKLDGPKVTFQGKEYPSVTVEVCSDNHPQYTGKAGLLDTTGRVENFNKRFGGFRRKTKAAE